MSKTILITGASTGIGAETARMLAGGNTIIVHYNSSREKAEQVARDVEKEGGKALLFQADLSTEDGCRRTAAFAGKECGYLDVLVNNAGGLVRRRPVREIDWALMSEIFALNTYSAMMMTSLCVPLLEKGTDPNVVNITSIAIRHGAPSATIYASSKGAIDVFTRGAAKELAPKIRVNAVAPGVIETPFHEKVSTPEQMKAWRESNPLKKNGHPIHIATCIKYFIDNDFLTGETIDINGGLFMR
jgi:3-oxoacyl-[acyl-carrier protein] reductase